MRRFSLASVVLVAVLVVLASSTTSQAVYQHSFNCAYCHLPGTTYATLTGDNVCLQCHKPAGPGVKFADGITRASDAGFIPQDASNAMGSRPAAVVGGTQSSHLWASAKDVLPAAGATAPSTTFYKSNYNTSVGKLTCSRCHNPHADVNPLLRNIYSLRPAVVQPPGTNVVNNACLDCHKSWNSATTHGVGTHPVNIAYPASDPNFISGGPSDPKITLVGGKVSCTTCHGTHFTDSDASTVDGPTAALSISEGHMLKHNGPGKEAATGVSICTTCHVYTSHGAPGKEIGCLVCHGGHNASDGSAPNIFLLNRTITIDDPDTPAVDPVTVTLNYTAYPPPTNYGGLCQQCHSALPSGHNVGDDCKACHSHTNATSGSFGASCGSCHGYPPVTDLGTTGSNGYAVDPNAGVGFLNGYKYQDNGSTLRAVYKNEVNTPHKAHAGGGSDYKFACAECHAASFPLVLATHPNQNFQDVSFTGQVAVTGGLGASYSPTVTAGNDGVCSNVYCHSNGGKRTDDGTRTYTVATIPAWENGAGTVSDCKSCHDGSAEMDGVADINSAAHAAHIAKGYTCNLCHIDTAVSNTTLAAGAIGGKHVNGLHDVAFNLAYPLGAANLAVSSYIDPAAGKCATYCHSSGVTQSSPDWDVQASGDCGACHQVSVGGVATGSGPALVGAHSAHVFDASGPKLACTICHTNNGTGADHVNGAKSMVAGYKTLCYDCHGGSIGGVGNDREPFWTIPTSVDCSTCHVGVKAVINTRTAPDKVSFSSTGHGKAGLTGAPACAGCHTLTADHVDGVSDSAMLTGGATANDAFCATCHPTKGSHYNNTRTAGGTSASADTCAICHEAHGDGMGTNTDVMLIVGSGFTDKNNAASYWNASFTGVCQVCHDPTDGTAGIIKHYNRSTADGHNDTTKCINCHTHDDTPSFVPGAGTSCDGCHGFPPTSNAHALHAPDALALDAAGTVLDTADRSACAHCHTGAGSYTYDQAADATSGVAGRKNHGVNETTQDNTLIASVGYNATTLNCTSACHGTVSGQAAAWSATSLACDACHGNPPADGGGDALAHSKHIAAGQTCATCHVSVLTDTAHISVKTGATELARVQNAAQALPDEANVVFSTWNDTNNTCGNAACHAPSGDGKLADWDSDTSSCILCHRDVVASGQAMQSGSHTSHVNNALVIGDNFSCSNCHPDAVGMAHRDGVLQVNVALGYDGEIGIPSAGVGTCNNGVCHYIPNGEDGVNSPNAPSNWGVDMANDCSMCHQLPSADGDHEPHFSTGRVAKGMTCYSCHAGTMFSAASNTRIKSGSKHLDGSKIDVVAGGNYDGSAVTITYNNVPDPSACTVNCHTTGNPKSWTPPTSCESCHGNLSYVGSTHTAHIDLTGGIEADESECNICHGDVSGYTLGEGGNHQDGAINLVGGISNTTCTVACHASAAGDGSWSDSNGLNCDACHGFPPAGDNHGRHIAAGMACSACHGTVEAAGTHPLTHNTAKDIDVSGLISNAEELRSRGKDYLNPDGISIAVSDAAYNGVAGSTWVNSSTIVDSGNSCSNNLCHDPSNNGNIVDWDEDLVSCAMCHGDGVGAPITSGSHSNHMNANAKFGLTVTCTQCHPDHALNTKHFMSGGLPNGQVQFGGTVITTQYQGEKLLPNSGYGTCSMNACHNNGKGQNAITAFTWGTPVATDCQFCHDDPPTSGRHSAHLGTSVSYGPYAGVASTNCGDCHAANNDLTMTGKSTHINGVINFDDGNSVATGGIVANATVSSCNNCHGAQVATANANAALAKAQWNTANRLTCESCHGDYGLASSKADASGVNAPGRAGSAYATKGHGMANTPASAIDGSKPVGKACSACHESVTGHISGVLGDVNRLQVLGGKNYGVLAEQNAWCDGCHVDVTVHAEHYANTQTAGGTSDDGLYCAVCHDPHGQNSGQDAMVASQIQGTTVTGFTDRSQRSSYANASFTGVCQVCHDGAEVPHFNRATYGDDGAGAHNSGNCLTCHKATGTPKYAASGCSGCHGGGYGATPYTNNYWPDSSNAKAENTAGRHLKHIQRLATVKYNETIEQLLTDNTPGNLALTSDVKQKVLCAYCHLNPGTDSDHSLTLPAEVGSNVAGNNMHNLWNNGLDANSTWSAGVNSGNCANVNCHNNQTTPSGFGWYGANATACTMCHVPGAADDLVNNNINPNSGLHKVVNSSTVQAHNSTMMSGGCTACHLSSANAPASHINGVANADGATNTDRFLNSGTLVSNAFLYVDGATNQASCSSTVGLIAGCHSDKGNWGRLWSKDADSISTALGSTRCNVCHGQTPGGSSLGWVTGYSGSYNMNGTSGIGHNLININDTSKHTNCEFCHVAPLGPYALYDYATMHENGLIETNNGAGVGYDAATGSCTNFCHPSGSTKTMAGSNIWNNSPLLGASPTCAECHDELGGGLNEPYKTSIPGFGGGVHAKHVNGAATVYADTSNKSTAAVYSYGCANCHPNSITFHNNGTIDVTLNNTHGGPLKSKDNTAVDPNYTLHNSANNWQISGGGITASGLPGARTLTCSAAYCHSDGKGGFNVTPNWYGGTFGAGDPCGKCHGNSPTGTSHQPHNVGIHYNNVYTGTTGVVMDASTLQNAHGDATTSTTINCNICHYDTVTDKVNAQNTVCATCHSDTNAPATGNEVVSIASKAMHVSGTIDVKFPSVSVLSRAQLRNPLANAPEINENWKRQNGYKVDATSHDETWDTLGTNLTRPLDTATMYDSATKNCTVACHNMNEIGWGASAISCSNCHTELPK